MSQTEPVLAPKAARPSHVAPDRVREIDIYNPPGSRQDYHGAWKAVQDSGVPEMIWTPYNEGHWIATSGRLVHQIFADYEKFSSHVIFVPKSAGEHHSLPPITRDPPEHRYFRLLLSSALSPKAVNDAEARIRAFAISIIEELRLKGACDFASDFAQQLPIRIFMEMVQIPFEDGAKIKYYVDHFTRPTEEMSFQQALDALINYVSPIAAARRGGTGTDLITKMVNGKIGDRPLTEREAAELSAQTLVGGVDTVVNMLSFVMLHLARHPESRAELIADPGLIPGAVEEFLRRFPIIADAREVIADIEFEGVSLKKGDMVTIPNALHGLDARENENPMAVDFRRTSIQHSSFGNGIHKCPGAHLARTEIKIVLQEWLSRIPEFSVAPGQAVTFSAGTVAAVDALPLVWDPAKTISQTDR